RARWLLCGLLLAHVAVLDYPGQHRKPFHASMPEAQTALVWSCCRAASPFFPFHVPVPCPSWISAVVREFGVLEVERLEALASVEMWALPRRLRLIATSV